MIHKYKFVALQASNGLLLLLLLLLFLNVADANSNFCLGKPDGLHANPDDCNKYYTCHVGISYQHRCAGSLVFNSAPSILSCDYPRNVDCLPGGIRGTNPGFCHGKSDGLHPHPTDCSKYYNCHSGIGVATTCPTGTLYNSVGRYCDWESNVICPGVLGNTDQANFCAGKRDGLYRNPSDCSKYYQCYNSGTTAEQSCASGLLFDDVLKLCNWPANVECSSATAAPATSTTPAPTTAPTTSTTAAPATSTTAAPTTSTTTAPTTSTTAAPTAAPTTPTSAPTTTPTSAPTTNPTAAPTTSTTSAPTTTPTSAPTTTPTAAPTTSTTSAPTTTPTSAPTTTPTVAPTTSTTTAPTTASTQVPPAGSPCPRRVCYHTNWSQYRSGHGKFLPTDLHPFLCTHIMYSFANLVNNELVAFEWNDDSTEWSVGHYDRVTNLKQQNPDLKVLLAVGGWNMASAPFTAMVATATTRAHFITTSIDFLRQRNFDGLDLDWEYPADRGSPPEDRDRFTSLVQELRSAFDAEGFDTNRPPLLLTAAVAAGKEKIDKGYDIPAISSDLDFINLMTYDLHGSWESFTGHNSPLYAGDHESGEDRELNVDWAANYWISQGCPPNKLVIGLPLYGRSFTLTTSNTSVGAPASPGLSGPFTREPGYAAYYEICEMLQQDSVQSRFLNDQRVPYLVLGDQWMGYDDSSSLREKVRYARSRNYGGVMAWAIDLDDFSGYFCNAGPYPLLHAIEDECGL